MKGIMNEFAQLFKEHKLLIAVVAVITVPILYAGMFLWAFWDPYDHLDDLPIAVVNEDEGAVEDGETLELGKELVENLEDDGTFNFHVVDKAEAHRGLNDEDYYIVIEIPTDFSESATTLMDDEPKKLDIRYIPNESYNFLASQIGETAMLQIKEALQEKVTETYAETIFEKIDEVAEGLDDASDATEDLHEGSEKLQDGSTKIMDNLHVLAEKTIEFTDGMETAADGGKELADGTNTLKDGMNQLGEGSNALFNASKEVEQGTADLAAGVKAAKDGIGQLDANIPSLINGTDELHAGVNKMQKELPKEIAKEINTKLNASTKAMNDGLKELENGITSGIKDGVGSIDSQAISDTIAEGVLTELGGSIETKEVSQMIANEMINAQTAQAEAIAKALLEQGVPEELVQGVMAGVAEQSPSQEEVVNSIDEQVNASIQQKMPSQEEISGKIKPKIDHKMAELDVIDELIAGIEDGFAQYSTEVNKGLTGATKNLETELKTAVDPAFNELKGGVKAINDGQKALAEGVGALSEGAAELQAGSNQLAAGQNEYVKNMGEFSSKFGEANNGVSDLVDGTNTLLGGLRQLEDGSFQLADGTEQLAEGSDELVDGMDELVDGTTEFKDEMNDAAKEANDIDTNEKTYNMMATPVDVKNNKINEVPNYGTGFAPYFLSLGLFVGALLLSIVYPLREPASTPKNGLHWFITKTSVLVAVGVLQALIACGILLIGLKLEVQSVPLFLLFSIITSLTFITLIQFLVTCLEDPGRFIAIIILILQLTTSAGTFPLELIPKVLQPINLLLPMTYSVAGFKAVISSGEYSVMWQNAGILLGFTALFVGLTISYFVVMFKRKYETRQENDVA
ncbi:YhgE/Pip domain-containing protein [Pseudogracilibacillus sp. ICA-222130]|uniref:YhgE/Pip domain-containing protein n=1 Tax=Pseudogracilibacillus sp. ICA-222130 TaxID=3134655 RepID=UPI0030BCC501